jgi:hypothetical protein
MGFQPSNFAETSTAVGTALNNINRKVVKPSLNNSLQSYVD